MAQTETDRQLTRPVSPIVQAAGRRRRRQRRKAAAARRARGVPRGVFLPFQKWVSSGRVNDACVRASIRALSMKSNYDESTILFIMCVVAIPYY